MSAEQPSTAAPALRFDADGLIPVIAQDEERQEVLLLAYMNAEALQRTLADGVLTLWSRSRQKLWRKGEQSGNTLHISELRVNCEGNSLLAMVRLEGVAACHEGYRSCYFRRVTTDETGEISGEIVEPRLFDPTKVYGEPKVDAEALTAADELTDLAAFERNCRGLYATYERLRDTDYTTTSSTSRLLREGNHEAASAHALARAAQEIQELRGVIEGTHRHQGGEADVILEASQVGYWVTLAAIANDIPYDAWKPHNIWMEGYLNGPTGAPPDRSHELLIVAAMLCRQGGVHPARVIAYDLAQMLKKYPESMR